jgi:hypothetical protein
MYQVTKWVTCATCGGSGKVDGVDCTCWCGQIEVKVDLEQALRDLGIIDQLGSQQVDIEELQTKMHVVAVR